MAFEDGEKSEMKEAQIFTHLLPSHLGGGQVRVETSFYKPWRIAGAQNRRRAMSCASWPE